MRALTTLLLPALLVLAACSSTEGLKEGTTEQEVYEQAQSALNRSNWQQAIETLHLLEEHFPFGDLAEQAQLELIYANYQAGNYAAVITSADRFIRLHPQHRNVDYAFYMRGLASFSQDKALFGGLLGVDNTRRDPGAARESFNYFSQLINRYPESAYASDAEKRMVYLRNVLARHEIHVANYYFRREAYLAAVNRGRYVVESFPQTPAVPDALAVMAQGYHLLDMPDLAKDAARVLAANYPDHPALEDNGEFDFRYTARGKRRGLISYLTLGLFDKNVPREFDTRDLYAPRNTYVEPPSS